MILNTITEKAGYLDGHTNIGVLFGDLNMVIIIDTGIDRGTGKQILRVLSNEKLSVCGILLTHAHADHSGGCAYIKEQTGAPIFAPAIEAAIVENPVLEPIYLYSGADPIQELRNKFIESTSCGVDHKIASDTKFLSIQGICFEPIPLRGHTTNQMGYCYDQVLFCGDTVFGYNILEHHKIPYFTNIGEAKDSISRLIMRKDRFVVCSHGDPTDSICHIGKANLAFIDNVEQIVLDVISDRVSTNEIIRAVSAASGKEVSSIQQFFLLNTVILSYLSYLRERNLVNPVIHENSLVWERSI